MFHQDKKLERLVPLRELCQKIPAGKFANSALAWQCTMFLSSMPPKHVWEVKPRSECFGHEDAPAPTLEEIMAALNDCGNVFLRKDDDGWMIMRELPGDDEGYGYEVTTERAPDNPATAALKLWFDVEGVK